MNTTPPIHVHISYDDVPAFIFSLGGGTQFARRRDRDGERVDQR